MIRLSRLEPTRYQRGITLLESLVTLTMLISLTVLVVAHLQQRIERLTQLATAQQLNKVTRAARAYLLDHFARFSQLTAEDLPVPIALAELAEAGYLPRAFTANRALDDQQISYHAWIIKVPEDDQLQVWITTRNTPPVSRRDWRQISALLGQHGSYMTQLDGNLTLITSRHDDKGLAWPKKLKPIPTVGQLVTHQLIRQIDVINSASALLHRKAIAGTQCNTMRTDLQLQQHAIVFQRGEPTNPASALLTIDAQKLQIQAPTHLQGPSLLITMPHNQQRAPTIQLQRQDKTVQLTPSAITLSGNALPELLGSAYWLDSHSKSFSRSRTRALEHTGSQLHRYWSRLPYHALPDYYYHRKKDEKEPKIQELADKICQRGQGNTLGRLGRLFMVGNQQWQHSATYICGKTQSLKSQNVHTQAYRIHVNGPLPCSNDNITPHSAKFSGVKLPTTAPGDPQAALRLYDFLYKLLLQLDLFLKLEEEILKDKRPQRSSRMNNYTGKLKNFYCLLKACKQDNPPPKSLEKKSCYQTFLAELYKKFSEHPHQQVSQALLQFVKYYKDHRPDHNPSSPNRKGAHKGQNYLSTHQIFIHGLLKKLTQCQDANKTVDVEKFAQIYTEETMQNFLHQCRNFKTIQDEGWAATVYLLARLIDYEYPEFIFSPE